MAAAACARSCPFSARAHTLHTAAVRGEAGEEVLLEHACARGPQQKIFPCMHNCHSGARGVNAPGDPDAG